MGEVINMKEHIVVINFEEQYSVWPTWKDVPNGWRGLDFKGTRQECLDHVKKVWTDMRPKSLKDAEEEIAKKNKKKLLN